MDQHSIDTALTRAATAIRAADTIVIGAGAGMGVDSGLPDFRGKQGFWRAYPAYAKLNMDWTNLARPHWFDEDPALAWGFYGHRLNMYRDATPHDGYTVLYQWASHKPDPGFVFTSNVDGAFAKAGFDPDRIDECHGTIHYLQCMQECGIGIFPAPKTPVVVDPETMQAQEPFPTCPDCGALARPNILMFGDSTWDSTMEDEQARRMAIWAAGLRGARVVILECGAGTAIPSVRRTCESLSARFRAPLIRINPGEPMVPRGGISIPLGARDALVRLQARVGL